MNRIAEIDQELTDLRRRSVEATGTTTEVYTRIVGYYRSLANWNKGKREEYAHRRTFSVETPTDRALEPSVDANETAVRYEIFVRATCPRCPAMKAAASTLGIPGAEIDVDTEQGIERAIELSIYATPTLVLYDGSGREVSRATLPDRIRTAERAAVV